MQEPSLFRAFSASLNYQPTQSLKGWLLLSAPPNYLRALLKIAPTLAAGECHVVDVLHDSWCACWRGAGCDCDPELIVHREAGDDDPR